jgi:long-chain acyl-CoA synthetase
MLVVPRVLTLIESAILRNIRSNFVRRIFIKLVHVSRFLPRPMRRFVFRTVHTKLGTHLTTLVVGGAPLPCALDRFFQGLGYRVVVGYGASECAPVISISLNQRRTLGEVGHPVPGVNMELNDKGEVIVRGDNVFMGYWPATVRPTFFNTEDVAVRTRSGAFTLLGRTKNLIVYPSGDKIFCEDVEYIASQVPGVEDACAVEVASSAGVTVHCAVKGDSALRAREDEVMRMINSKLPLGIRLDKVIALERERFPYTHTLKPDRKAIQAICTTSA